MKPIDWYIPFLLLFIVLIASLLIPSTGNEAIANGGPSQPAAQASPAFLVVRAGYATEAALQRLLAWKEPWEVDRQAMYVVLDVLPQEVAYLESLGFTVTVDDQLTELYNRPAERLPGQTSGIPGYACYRTVEETYASAGQIVAEHPTLAAWVDIGDSWDKQAPGGAAGYDLQVLVLTNQASGGDKPKLFIMSSVHAREYTPAELSTRFAEYLVDNYNVDADITWLLDYHEIHLLLQANPDGRKYAEAGDLWRKNTDQNYCGVTSSNRGADLNRNFSFSWNMCGNETCSSSNVCWGTYRGPNPASEPETQSVEAYVQSIFPDQRADPLDAPAPPNATGLFMDMHSYGGLVLWPWGFDDLQTANGVALQTLGRKFAYFNDYAPQQAVELYPTDGATDDFAYGDLGVAAFTFEVGTTFFQGCSYFEQAVLPDNLPALVYAAKAARAPYQLPAGPQALAVTATPGTVAAGEPLTLTATIDDTLYQQDFGAEPTQNIAAAEYFLDVPPWEAGASPLPMSPADGAFDAKTENVQVVVDTGGLSAGRHILYVRGRDQAGNWGTVSAIFVRTEAPAAPVAGFTSSSPDTLGETTVFTNTSSGAGLEYNWNFGDGSPASVAEEPMYVYDSGGDFTVTLTVSNTLGMDVYTDTVEIWDDILYFPIVRR